MVAYDTGWWEFDNSPPNDYLIDQADHDDFDPAGDFTVMMLVEEMTQSTNGVHGIVGKYSQGLGEEGGWDVNYYGSTATMYPGGIWFRTGKRGTHYTDLRLHTPGPMLTERKVLIVCSYKWISDGTSIMRIVTYDAVNGKLSAQVTNAYGPVANTSYKLRMGNTRSYVAPTGKYYWCGFYDGVVISDADILEVWNETKHPVDDFNPTVLNYFCQDVGSTYTADVGTGANAPYIFDVQGTPLKGGTCTANDTAILGHQFGIQLPSSNILGHQFTVLKKLKRYRSLSFRDRITFKRTI